MGKKGRCQPKTELDKARFILNQIRNAFAHGPFNPRWHIDKKNQKEIQVNLNGKTIIFKGDELDGEGFSFEQIGGLDKFMTLLIFLDKEADSKNV